MKRRNDDWRVKLDESLGEEFEAEAILDKRTSACGRRVHYLVKWQGYPPEASTWEPPSHLKNCTELIRIYEKMNQDRCDLLRALSPHVKKKGGRSTKKRARHDEVEFGDVVKDEKAERLSQVTKILACNNSDGKETTFEAEFVNGEREWLKYTDVVKYLVPKLLTFYEQKIERGEVVHVVKDARAARLQMVTKIVNMDNAEGEETAYEVQFASGEREWLTYRDAYKYLPSKITEYYEHLLKVNGGRKYD